MSTFYKIQTNCRLFQYFSGVMQRNAAVLTIVCVLLCFTFNYTFPLHRETSDISLYANSTPQCDIPVHRDNIGDRSKKMASNIGNALKRIKDSTQEIGKNIYDHVNVHKNSEQKNASVLSEEDLRQYEQLVIMKKYPYLDINEFELKYSPSNKNARQSIKFEPGSSLENEPGFCEQPSLEEGPNVEITNRGLSGFAIPPQMTKYVNMVEIRSKTNKIDSDDKLETLKLAKKSSEQNIMGRLKNDVREYVERKTNRLK